MKADRHSRRRAPTGFTLVEVLVALLIMSILAGLAWQGLDGILRAREASRLAIEGTVRLATVLTQWEQDLKAVYDTGMVPPLSFDGQTLRLTRRTEGGVVLVAWALHGSRWQRWTSPVQTRGGGLQDSWLRSQQLQGAEAGQLTLTEGATQWQVYFNRGGQWTNAQSTGDLAQPVVAVATTAAAAAASAASAAVAAVVQREALPGAVRLQITLASGVLTRDIALVTGGS